MNLIEKVTKSVKKMVADYAQAKRVSQGRAASHILRQINAKENRRGKPVLNIKTIGEQHRLWRAAGRVGVPSDY